MLNRVIIPCCVFLACTTISAGQMYKWKDEDGNIHFTQKAPPSNAIPIEKKNSSGSQNAVESNWSKEMQQNARDFMNRAGVRRVWVDRNGNEVKSRNRY